MYPLIYRLHAEFNLSEMQREGRQLKRAMIADAKSSSHGIFYSKVQMEKGYGNTKYVYVYPLEVAVE